MFAVFIFVTSTDWANWEQFVIFWPHIALENLLALLSILPGGLV